MQGKSKIIISLLAIAALIGIGVLAYKKYGKKPCPCKGQTPDQAIANMSKDDLMEQITKLEAVPEDLSGKTIDQLRERLKKLIA